MGCCRSRSLPNERKNNDSPQNKKLSENPEIDELEKTLNNDVETFILDQLLINVMFFCEYNENKNPAGHELKLLHDKQIILPDVVLNSVGHMIRNKKTKTSLTTKRMYINLNIIDIENEETISNEPLYKAKMEISKQHKGFVLLEIPNYSEKKYYPKFVKQSDDKRKTPYIPSTDKKNQTEYVYEELVTAKTPRPVHSVDNDNNYTRGTELPPECFTLLSKGDKKMYYLNSREFMDLFKTNVFPKYLGKDLDFPPDSLQNITSIDGSLFCKSNSKDVYEIFPAITITWPSEISDNWKTQLNDKKWLTDIWTDDIDFNCVLTAKGFVPKKGKNQCKDIEWEIEFPQAEQFLESNMPPLQKSMFALLMMLYHRFLENKSNKADLLINHIRHFMFWECENNKNVWRKDTLGSKLKEILEKLSDHLSTSELKHYFIPDINLFENLPRSHLCTMLDKFEALREEPLRHILHVFKDITKTKKFDFDLNLDELWDMLYNDFKTNKKTDNVNHANLKMENIDKEELKNDKLSEISLKKKFEGNLPLTDKMITFFINQLRQSDQWSERSSGTNSIYSNQAQNLEKLIELVQQKLGFNSPR